MADTFEVFTGDNPFLSLGYTHGKVKENAIGLYKGEKLCAVFGMERFNISLVRGKVLTMAEYDAIIADRLDTQHQSQNHPIKLGVD